MENELYFMTSSGLEIMHSRHGLKPLEGQSQILPDALVYLRQRKEIWVMGRLSCTDNHVHQGNIDVSERPSVLFALAFQVLRLAILSSLRQSKARFYKLWCRNNKHQSDPQ